MSAVPMTSTMLLRVDSDGEVALTWDEHRVEFQLAYRGDAAFEWFARAADVDPAGPYGFLWEAQGWVEAPVEPSAWSSILPLLAAPRPVMGCSPDPGIRAGLAVGPVRRSTVTPAELGSGEFRLLCRSITVEARADPEVLEIAPLRGQPIAIEIDGEDDDPRGLVTQFGTITLAGREPTMRHLSRFPELWDPDRLTQLTPPPEAAGATLLASLTEIPGPVVDDPERLEMLVPPPDLARPGLIVRHVISDGEDEVTTLLRGDEDEVARARRSGATWRPIIARAVTEVVWTEGMMDADLAALAADPTPTWEALGDEVRGRVSGRLLRMVADELAAVGCLVPWVSDDTESDPRDRRRRRLRVWLDGIDPEDDFDGFLEDGSSTHAVTEDGGDYSLRGAIEAALLLRTNPLPEGGTPSPLRTLKLISWLVGRIDDEQWEFDLDAARERQADEHFAAGTFGDVGDHMVRIARERWLAPWPDDGEDPED